MELVTTKELSVLWGISARRIAVLCEENRIKGALKKGKTWLIPKNVDKPYDERHKRITGTIEDYKKIESRYNVIYPDSPNATYTSLLNYSDDLNKPFQRWYRYKEGYSVELVEQLINEYCCKKKGVILDPFSGSGSTLLAAKEMGYSSVGFEVNPFSFFLAQCKLDTYDYLLFNRCREIYRYKG